MSLNTGLPLYYINSRCTNDGGMSMIFTIRSKNGWQFSLIVLVVLLLKSICAFPALQNSNLGSLVKFKKRRSIKKLVVFAV